MIIKSIILSIIFLTTFVTAECELTHAQGSFIFHTSPNEVTLVPEDKAFIQTPQITLSADSHTPGCMQFFAPLFDKISNTYTAGLKALKDAFSYASSGLYQMFVSNRFFGEESGSCQSFNSILNASAYKNKKIESITSNIYNKAKTHFLNINNNNDAKNLIVLYDEYCGWNSVQDAIATANHIQKKTDAQTVCLPLNLHLKNIIGQQIMHRVLFSAKYDSSKNVSISVIDPQTNLSANYLSNAQEIIQKDFDNLPQNIEKNFVSAGIQIPFTGNCQKLSLYLAVQICEEKPYTIADGNSFCTALHIQNKPIESKAKTILSTVKSVMKHTFSSLRRFI